MAVRTVSILAGRDRISEVLSRFLEDELALERANNIAQALLFSTEEPEEIALQMLRGTGLTNLQQVARAVSQAWSHGVIETERAC
jgi:hypothetical protein